jgi:hypothetical protein
VSPEDFGAVADGAADDAGPVQLAINYIATLGRGSVVFTPGRTYFLNAQINLCDNLTLVGYGAKVRIGTAFAGIDNPLFKNFAGTSLSAPGARVASKNIAVMGFEFDGENAGGAAGTLIPDANMRGPSSAAAARPQTPVSPA